MTESSSEPVSESTVNPLAAPAVSETVPVAAEATLAKKKAEGEIVSLALQFWWIPTSYFIPYLFTYLFFAGHNSDDSFDRAGRVGAIGLFSAALIYVIWFIDCKFGARQIFSSSRDTAAKTLVYLLGLALWVSWLAVGIAMNMSYDQVNNVPSTPSMRVP
jgi:membrane protease YdiL (CAAX protease family)